MAVASWKQTVRLIAPLDNTTNIASRAHGEIVVMAVYSISGTILTTQEICRVQLEHSKSDGAIIEIWGTGEQSAETKQAKALGINRRAYGQRALSFDVVLPDPYVKPGDSVTIGSDTITAGEISYLIETGRELQAIISIGGV